MATEKELYEVKLILNTKEAKAQLDRFNAELKSKFKKSAETKISPVISDDFKNKYAESLKAYKEYSRQLKELNKANSDNTVKNNKKSSDSFSRLHTTIGQTLRSSARLMLFFSGAIVGGVQQIKDSLDSLEMGFREQLQVHTLENRFAKQAAIINRASGGLINRQKRGELAMRASSFGLNDEEKLKKLTQMGTALAKATGKEAGQTTELFFNTIFKGRMPENLLVLAPGIGDIVNKAVKLNSKLSQTEKQLMIINILMKNFDKTMQQLGESTITSTFEDLLSVITQMKDSMRGLDNIVAGMSKAMIGVLAPIGGGLAALAFGGPILGAVGVIAGGIVSTALGAGLINIFKTFAGKEGSVQDKKDQANAYLSIVSEFLGAGLLRIGQKSVFTDIPLHVAETAFGTKDIEIIKGKLIGMGEISRKAGLGVREFGESWSKGFEETMPHIQAAFDFAKKYSPIAFDIGMGKFAGKDTSGINTFAYIMAKLLGEILATLVAFLPFIAAGVGSIAKRIDYFTFSRTASQEKQYQKDVDKLSGLTGSLSTAKTPEERQKIQKEIDNLIGDIKDRDRVKTAEGAVDIASFASTTISAIKAVYDIGKEIVKQNKEAIEYDKEALDVLREIARHETLKPPGGRF